MIKENLLEERGRTSYNKILGPEYVHMELC